MCGICGFYSKAYKTFNNTILKMNLAISHRGPDSSGVWQDREKGIFIGHQRLSILDLSIAGNQPMISNSGRFVLTFNGEIYNHLEIRKELQNLNFNIKWKSNTDTETLLEALELWGIEKTLKKVVGMFAFGIWDKKNHHLTLARDRVGEKPLYFGWQGNGENKVFIFGSELKALKLHPEFDGKINRNAVALQMRLNSIPDPYSIYKDIYKLLPGHYIKLNENDLNNGLLPKPKKYWSIMETAVNGINNQHEISKEDIERDLENNLKLSVKQQMLSDVPIGAFLSGGIDSSTIVALMQSQSNRSVKTFTIGFGENDHNEARHAKKIANYLGTDHTEFYVSPKKAMQIIPKLPIIYDEPFSDSSQIPTFFVSELASKNVKVALSGDGADELLCGYGRYISADSSSKKFDLIPTSLRNILAYSMKSIGSDSWNKIFNLLPINNNLNNYGHKIHKGANALEAKTFSELYYILCSDWQNPSEVVINSKESLNYLNELEKKFSKINNQQKMMILDTMNYLPNDILVKVDRAAMNSSLETRVPFLNHKLIEYIWKIPHGLKFQNGEGKLILKKILSNYIPKKLMERPKKGFSIPLDSWLRGPLKDWAENLLSEKRLSQEGYFNVELVRRKWSEHINNEYNWQNDLWNVLMFQAWIDVNN